MRKTALLALCVFVLAASPLRALDVPELINDLGSADQSVSAAAAEALVKAGPDAVPQLLTALERGGGAGVINVLAAIKDERAAGPLAGLLDSPDKSLSEAAWGALVAIGEKAAPALLEYMGRGNDPEYAARALVNFRAAEPAVGMARGLLGSEDPRVRANAAYVLGAWGDEGSLDTIKALVRDKDRYVREKAMNAYGMAAAKTGKYDGEFLLGLVGDESPFIRRTAAGMLPKTGRKGITEPLTRLAKGDPDGGVREAALNALGSTGDRSVIPVLIGGLGDPDDDAVVSALWHMDDLGAKEAVPHIIKMLEAAQDRGDLVIQEAFITLRGLDAEVDAGTVLPYLARKNLHVKEEGLLLIKARKDKLTAAARKELESLAAREEDGRLRALYEETLGRDSR